MLPRSTLGITGLICSFSLLLSPPTMATNTNQISTLPQPIRYVTTHDEATGKAIVQSAEPAQWSALDNNEMGFSVPFTTSQWPISMTNDTDIKQHDQLMDSGKLGLVNPGGSVFRIVDFAPGGQPLMHRTVSLDYGVIIEGEIEMQLDSGEKRRLKRGDVTVQRGTMHAWRNVSDKEWARMMFVLLSSEQVEVGGKKLEENLPDGTEIPSSQ